MLDSEGLKRMVARVVVDQDLCISSGRCVAEEPTVFRFDEDEVAEATGTTEGVDRARLVDAARGCPAGAITVVDDDGRALDPSA